MFTLDPTQDLTEQVVAFARDHAAALVEQAQFGAGEYTRQRLAACATSEVWLMSWLPGQSTSIHDHGGSVVVTVVLAGELFEEQFDHVAGDAVVLARTAVRPAGDVDRADASMIHRVSARTGPAISLHLYAPYNNENVRTYTQVQRTKLDAQVIVIGGGFCGAMTAAHLAARGLDTLVLEPGPLGRGLAYADGPANLLLNTPAWAMSALPDRPDDFTDWLAARGERHVFAPRARYGDYLRERIAQLSASAPLAVAETRAIDVARTAHGFAVLCEDGTLRRAQTLVLALGNAPPRTPHVLRGYGAYRADPYGAAMDLPADDTPLALLGSGLTALDVVATLRARGHRGKLTIVSRRGLVPATHPGARPTDTAVVPRELIVRPRLASLLAWWRASSHASITARVDALRPHLAALWRGLSPADRVRFVRHVRPHWETVRHRAPAPVREVFDAGIADGSIELLAGRLAGAELARTGLRIRFVDRDGRDQVRDVGALINCTGPERDVARQPSPLVRALVARGLVTADALGLGVTTDLHGAASPGLYVVGPWRIADLWESTAVGELRAHAADTATAIADALVIPVVEAAIA